MARIAIDMDEVIADALGGILDGYNEITGSSLTKTDLHGFKTYDYFDEKGKRIIDEVIGNEEFWFNLKIIDGSQEVIKKLSENHEIFIATAAMEIPVSLKPKFHWLQEHFPFIPKLHYIFCGHKYSVACDYLIDDNIEFVSTCTGQGIFFDAPRNKHLNGYPRINSWHEAEDKINELESIKNSNGKPSIASCN